MKNHDSEPEIARKSKGFETVSPRFTAQISRLGKVFQIRARRTLSPRSPAPHPRKARHRLEVVEVHAVADILARGVAERLEVPGADLALGQSRVDEPAAALAFAHLRVERGEIPALCDLGAERGDPVGVARRPRQIVALARIALKVVELVGVGRANG